MRRLEKDRAARRDETPKSPATTRPSQKSGTGPVTAVEARSVLDDGIVFGNGPENSDSLHPVVRIDLGHYLHAGTFQPVDCFPVKVPRSSSPDRTARPRCASRLPASGPAPAARFDVAAGQRNASVSMSTAQDTATARYQ